MSRTRVTDSDTAGPAVRDAADCQMPSGATGHDAPATGPDGHLADSSLQAHLARVDERVTVISLVGEVDLATADVFSTVVFNAVSAGPGQRVVLELNRVRFLGARGLGVISVAHHQAVRSGGAVALVVDQVAPCASSLRFLPTGPGPVIYPTLSSALTRAGTE